MSVRLTQEAAYINLIYLEMAQCNLLRLKDIFCLKSYKNYFKFTIKIEKWPIA